MNPLATIAIGQIITSGRIREPDPAQVEALKASILEIGLLNPISVCRFGERQYRLVAGGNRLQACIAAGYEEIECRILDLTDFERIIAECDENLCGPKLSPAEKALFLSKRKEAYEAIYGPAKAIGAHAANAAMGQENASANLAVSFTADAAAKTGESERSIQRHTDRGHRVISEALEMISGTVLDTGAYLDKIKRLSPNDQVQAIRRDLAISKKADDPKSSSAASDPLPQLPTYDAFRASIQLLDGLSPNDFLSLCPAPRRAAMCAHLASLSKKFEAVMIEVLP